MDGYGNFVSELFVCRIPNVETTNYLHNAAPVQFLAAAGPSRQIFTQRNEDQIYSRNACKESQLLSEELACLDRCSVAVGGHSVKICRICF